MEIVIFLLVNEIHFLIEYIVFYSQSSFSEEKSVKTGQTRVWEWILHV